MADPRLAPKLFHQKRNGDNAGETAGVGEGREVMGAGVGHLLHHTALSAKNTFLKNMDPAEHTERQANKLHGLSQGFLSLYRALRSEAASLSAKAFSVLPHSTAHGQTHRTEGTRRSEGRGRCYSVRSAQRFSREESRDLGTHSPCYTQS